MRSSFITSSSSLPIGVRLLFLSVLLLLAACGNYQAPLSEQGEALVVNAPIIVNSSTPDSSLRVSDSRAVVSSSSSSSASNPVISSSSPRQRGGSNTSGASLPSTHRVRPGDTLFSIAFQYDLDFRSLAIANGLNPPYTIFVDRELSLDINNIASAQGSLANSNIGTAVSNNSAAQARAAGTSGGVLRQPIGRSSIQALQWQWPHQGRLVRGFQAGINKGLDISGNSGEPVLAAGDGDVVYSGRGVQGTGDLIIIRHSDRYLSAYAHNSVMLVNEGSRVRAGEKIAEIGENPSGVPMLHFEIREDGNSIDPVRFLPRR